MVEVLKALDAKTVVVVDVAVVDDDDGHENLGNSLLGVTRMVL